MAKAIAVFLGEHGETAALEQPGQVMIYQKQQGRWQILRTKEFNFGQVRDARALRTGITEMVAFLEDCKIFVGRSVTGLPYFELEKAGRCVWEMTGKPVDFLDYVLTKEEESIVAEAEKVVVMPVAEDLGCGCYRISIKEIQEADLGITSKQALQPILRQGDFFRLEVLCRHVPPWLEAETILGNLTCISENLGSGEERVVISKK